MKGNMSPTAREELQDALHHYIADTFTYIDTVRGFCENISKWMLQMKSELLKVMEIREMADSRLAKLEKELAAVPKDTLEGLEKLNCFLDAVEKLAVTSLHVFVEDNQDLQPTGIGLRPVQVVIFAARLICPLLLEFKRDASVFFLPRLKNVEVLAYQLDKYIKTTQKICETLKKSSFSDVCPKTYMNTVVDLDGDFSEDDVQRMLCDINQLKGIRMNQNFRMVYLFQEMSCSGFINEFSERQPRMLQFLKDLEDTAVQLDRMNLGAKISSVTGSSVAAVGGVLSIVGLALIPITAGVSLSLMTAGIGLGVTSGVNSLVTTATEVGVNRAQQMKAKKLFKSFTEDVQILQDCLEVNKRGIDQTDVVLGVDKVHFTADCIAKGIDALIDTASGIKMLKSEKLITTAGRIAAQEGKALRNVPRLASDIPDIGQAVVKGPLALTKTARAGFIVANALFLGLDVFLICEDSISLYNGSETELSRFIRARAALWRSEMDSWQKIHDSLREGLLTSGKNQAILDTPFYAKMEMNKKRKEKLKETWLCVVVLVVVVLLIFYIIILKQ